MCCSQEALTLREIRVTHSEWKVSMRRFQCRDCCDDRAGLGGDQTAWGARPARADSAVPAVLPHCGRAWGSRGHPSPVTPRAAPRAPFPLGSPSSGVCWPHAAPSSSRQGQASWALAWVFMCCPQWSQCPSTSPPGPHCFPPPALPAPSAHPLAAPQYWPVAGLASVFPCRDVVSSGPLVSLLDPVPGP